MLDAYSAHLVCTTIHRLLLRIVTPSYLLHQKKIDDLVRPQKPIPNCIPYLIPAKEALCNEKCNMYLRFLTSLSHHITLFYESQE